MVIILAVPRYQLNDDFTNITPGTYAQQKLAVPSKSFITRNIQINSRPLRESATLNVQPAIRKNCKYLKRSNF